MVGLALTSGQRSTHCMRSVCLVVRKSVPGQVLKQPRCTIVQYKFKPGLESLPTRTPSPFNSMEKLLPAFLTNKGNSGSPKAHAEGTASPAAHGVHGIADTGSFTPGRLTEHPKTGPGTPLQPATNPRKPPENSHASTMASSDSSRDNKEGPALTTCIGVSNAQGQRNYQEDRHTIIPDFDVGAKDGLPRQFLAVYDGHSSHHGSEHASKRMHEIIASQEAVRLCQGEPRSRGESDAMEEALKAAFGSADKEILDTAVRGGNRYGTTAVCALRVGRVVYVAHAGDSRAVLCRDGRAVSLTKDHKPTNPEEAQRIEAQGGQVDYLTNRVQSNPEGSRLSKLNMSRALGDPDFKGPRRLVESEPDVARVVLKPGRDSFILLGSDGLFDVMSNQEAVDLVNELMVQQGMGAHVTDEAAELAARSLVKHALKLRTSDNVTAVVMLVKWN